ncbi:MAG: hypothetical protein ACLTA5_06320 [Anaerococcus obesiensis]
MKVGEELTVSALTKGLSIENRSSIHRLCFGKVDYILMSMLFFLVVLFIRG